MRFARRQYDGCPVPMIACGPGFDLWILAVSVVAGACLSVWMIVLLWTPDRRNLSRRGRSLGDGSARSEAVPSRDTGERGVGIRAVANNTWEAAGADREPPVTGRLLCPHAWVEYNGVRYALPGASGVPFSLGAAPGSSVRLQGVGVRGSHATIALERIDLEPDGYVLYHVMWDGALTTVRVNSGVVTRHVLRDRDRISIGNHIIYFRRRE